jgi:hypothetical protein
MILNDRKRENKKQANLIFTIKQSQSRKGKPTPIYDSYRNNLEQNNCEQPNALPNDAPIYEKVTMDSDRISR